MYLFYTYRGRYFHKTRIESIFEIINICMFGSNELNFRHYELLGIY